jgi:hypothetical protein
MVAYRAAVTPPSLPTLPFSLVAVLDSGVDCMGALAYASCCLGKEARLSKAKAGKPR